MPGPVHFEIQATDPDRAIRFYQQLLGWDFTRWEGPMEYWLIKTGEHGPGIDKMPVPGIGWLAYGKDTEGNIWGFMQNDPSAT